MAGGTVADHLGLPFISVAAALPVNLDASAPPVNIPWSQRVGYFARQRNRLGNALSEWIFSGALATVNHQRRAWTAPDPRFQLAVLGAGSGIAIARRPRTTRTPPSSSLPPHRPLGGRDGASPDGLPLVTPRLGPAPGVRLYGDAPERGPPDLPDVRRGVRRPGSAAKHLARVFLQ
jgi:hypothetical protein